MRLSIVVMLLILASLALAAQTGAQSGIAEITEPIGRACSQASNEPVTLTFANQSSGNVEILWRDFECAEVTYNVLSPGQSYTQATFSGHSWLVRDAATQEVLRIAVPISEGVATIDVFDTPTFQSDAAANLWEVLLHDAEQNQLVTLTVAGVAATSRLPAEIQQLAARINVEGGTHATAVSPDGRYVAVELGFGADLRLVDLQTSNCCPRISGLPDGLNAISAGDFSPDGTQLVAPFFAGLNSTAEIEAGLLIVDIASNSVVATLPEERFLPPGGVFSTVTEWRADGIYFMPNCYGCEPALDGTFQRWNPVTDEVVETGEFISLRGDRLDATGEWIIGKEDLRFPVSPEEVIFFPPSNVVDHFQFRRENAIPIYHDPDNLSLEEPQWVLDGAAFLLLSRSDLTLVYRDGRSTRLAVEPDTRFLAGTPDGWLLLMADNRVLHYAESGGSFAVNTLAQFDSEVRVVEAPLLGARAGEGAFSALQPPPPVVCEGAPPSRLVANRGGRVLPGPANNLRAEPTANSARVGQMPGGEFFEVLQGPICAEGLAWWFVFYQGTEGWTAEGEGATYWVEPAGF